MKDRFAHQQVVGPNQPRHLRLQVREPDWASRHLRAESDAKQVRDIAHKSLTNPSHRIDLL
jgi:hypothetical protein